MGKSKYALDLKMQIVQEYEEGKCGYKKLARKYGLSRDTVRDFVLNPKLHCIKEMAKKQQRHTKEEIKDVEYLETAVALWKNYALLLEEEIAKQKDKKKILLTAMKKTARENSKIKIRKMCEVAKISKSTYYYHQKDETKKGKDKKIIELITKLPEIAKLRAGSKVKSKMLEKMFGITVNHKRMWRICRENGYLAKNRRRKHPKDYYKRVKEEQKNKPHNKLQRNFDSDVPLKKICTDVSYFKTKSGWLYLSCALDLHNRKIIAYSVSKKNDEKLILDMLDQIEQNYNLEQTLIHSDQGAVYFAKNVVRKMNDLKMIRSMSGRGNCWDNACMEHYFGTLKVESGYDDLLKSGLLSFNETKILIDNFTDFYNNVRIQKGLGWKTPSQMAA